MTVVHKYVDGRDAGGVQYSGGGGGDTGGGRGGGGGVGLHSRVHVYCGLVAGAFVLRFVRVFAK